jgi:hypothetical protein
MLLLLLLLWMLLFFVLRLVKVAPRSCLRLVSCASEPAVTDKSDEINEINYNVYLSTASKTDGTGHPHASCG